MGKVITTVDYVCRNWNKPDRSIWEFRVGQGLNMNGNPVSSLEIVDQLREPESIPRATPYASLIEADMPIVVQHTRLDSRQTALALMTTLAFGVD